ncbi:hypothetical protein D0N36_08725 [Hymenobacter lapidiphilus]|uniref:hypothetical protein n=1 Tax=Hymenobacter sp. CCM 8763 TaxID=2303334 RepID=UPI000E34D7AF|nr:hypothetical protein [Hymenobacter sp. CCM 8763]RFP65552.1 hypothetical protein D0N36_08725 [Hymenobacter sp. CCM 8763]
MLISDNDQLEADIDWFATDSDGHILHMASGGGVLPESVAASQEDLMTLHQYFLTLPETGAGFLVIKAERGIRYESFLRYARRGLFSFDKVQLHIRADTRYQLLARPAVPLLLAELPPELAQLLHHTQLPGSVATLDQLDAAAIA